MAKIVFFSDPHLGLARKAHFTAESSKRRDNAALEALHTVLMRSGHRICAGDLFDKVSNTEEIIIQGLHIVSQLDYVLAGNHDIPNRADRESSLYLLDEAIPGRVILANFTLEIGNSEIYMVPHSLTDEQFQKDLNQAAEEANHSNKYRVLVLHCNYNLPSAFGTDATLNLTEAQAMRLLGTFHHILIGHHHTAADYFEGRLKLIGSTFPTAFDNLDRKRALEYDTETGLFEDIVLWDPAGGVLTGTASSAGYFENCLFYDLVDDLPIGEAQKLAATLFKAGALGVRITKPAEADQAKPKVETHHFDRLPETIGAELKADRPHLVSLWDEMLAETGEANG
jgi:DNA repair exonuclease SbcCD nuclease subunit